MWPKLIELSILRINVQGLSNMCEVMHMEFAFYPNELVGKKSQYSKIYSDSPAFYSVNSIATYPTLKQLPFTYAWSSQLQWTAQLTN